MSKITCLGIATADIITKTIKEMPEAGKLELVDSIKMYTGGCAVNTAIDLAKLGEDVSIITLVGNDGMGSFLTKELKENGVGIEGLKTSKEACTSSSVVLINESGERSFLHTVGTNGLFSEKDIEWNIIEDSDVLFVAGALLMPTFDGIQTAKVLKKAQDKGVFTILDTAWDSTGQWMKKIEPCLPYLDLFIPSIEEAEMLSGLSDEKDMANMFMEKGTKQVVIKLGKKGCYIQTKEQELYVPAYEVDAVDTTGAGDSFVAGFITGLVNKWDLLKSGKFANAVGAKCVMEVGSSSGIENKEHILKYMEENA